MNGCGTPVQGRRWRDHRQVINAICWVKRTGSPWRALPERYGPRNAVSAVPSMGGRRDLGMTESPGRHPGRTR
ncbi:transposase [Actinoplanes sp. N902-109]|uniref:transposase n=1 Tax=Actinoplanes sp. (strain N902-109) TaxID=649831 RepID=UPI000A04D382